jgi:mannose-6-phosphate isomerase
MPTIQRFEPRDLGPKPWGTELLVAHTEHYTGKVLFMKAGGTGALQYHEKKDETFYLLAGTARVYFHNERGELDVVEMPRGDAFHVPPGAVHRVEAVTDCVFVEASTPIFDDRVKVG